MNPRREGWLLTRLFDLSFSRFVSLTLIRIVYVLLMIAGVVVLAFGILYLFQVGQRETTFAAVLVLVLGPILYFIYLLFIRLICETLIVVFAMAEDLDEIREALQQRTNQGPPAPPA
jgi:hypothetical protein